MMKKTTLLIVCASLLFYGCNDAQDWPEERQQADLSVVGVGFTFESKSGMSKYYFDPGDEIGLQIYNSGGMSLNKLTYLNPGWSLDTSVLLPPGDTDIHACYPYDTADNPPGKLLIEHVSQQDYLYGRTMVNPSDPMLHLNMKHALSLIEFEFEPNPEIQFLPFNYIAVEGPAIHSRAALDMFSGEIEYDEEMCEPAMLYSWQLESPIIFPEVKLRLMVVPVQKVKQEWDAVFYYDINGLKSQSSFPVGTCWESGKKYTYRVRSNGREINIVHIQIEDWTDAGKEKIVLP